MNNYNAASPRFACYLSTNHQQPVQLYVSTATTDIRNLQQMDAEGVNVFSIDGRLLRSNVQPQEALMGLSKGIYIVGIKKMVVK